MHIVFVTAFFTKNKQQPLSGMPRYIYKTASLLQKCGHDTEIIAGSTDDRTWKYKNVKVHNAEWSGALEGTAVRISSAIIRREYAMQKKLREIDLKYPIDIVQYAGWSGTGFMHSLRCPAVLRLSTYSKIQYSQSDLFRNGIHVYSFWERIAGKRAEGIITPSKVIGDCFGKDIKRKITIMETPYSSDDVVEDNSVYQKILKTKRYLLFYGTFSKDKGIEIIGEMLSLLFKENTELYFVCAGWDVKTESGSAVQKLRKRLGEYKDRMIYLGTLDQGALYPIIRNAECVLIPSLIDNLPNACLEALSLDQIVIGTYRSSLEQMICDGINGFLSEPGDPYSLLDCVKKVLCLTAEQKKSMIANNRKMMKRYAPDAVTKKLLRYYRWLMERTRGYHYGENSNCFMGHRKSI